MLTSCKELKRIARGNLEGHYPFVIKMLLMAHLIRLLIETPFIMQQTAYFSSQNIILYVARFLIFVLAIILTCGQYRIHLNIANKKEVKFSDLFYPIKHHPDRFLLSQFIYLGILFLTLLPGIIGLLLFYFKITESLMIPILCSLISLILFILAFTNFSLVFLYITDCEHINAFDAFKQIIPIMKRNKIKYLYMNLSFLALILVSFLSLGIGLLWVIPYQMQTTCLFYLQVSGKLAPETCEIPETAEPIFNQYI